MLAPVTRDKADLIKSLCDAITLGDEETIASTLKKYPFAPQSNVGRKYTEVQAAHVFMRDGYIDRYSGVRLVNPAVLRLLSKVLPRDFPFHPNWKMTETHPAYWELIPTIDHIVPVARGGPDTADNWVTTSMLRNAAKSNWTLEELGWTLLPPGDYQRWDGLTGWLIRYIETHGLENQEHYVVRWYKASSNSEL